ncbi:hypothetical protein [Microcoleus sp. D2_18a_B4]|uniref:hypothetical protein n=1 Tax=Microcoleus sp. D2_18a_B4 TaxID=3055329 RepID=UPI002FD05329
MNHSTKLSRRSLLILLSGFATTIIAAPTEAAKKGKRNRGDRYYPRNTYPTPSPVTPSSPAVPTPPPAPEPYRPTSPALMFGVGGGVLGGFGLLGAWLIKMNQK